MGPRMVYCEVWDMCIVDLGSSHYYSDLIPQICQGCWCMHIPSESSEYITREDSWFMQWNLSVTTTSIMKFITGDLSSYVFNDGWKDQFTRVNNFCSLELI